VIDVSADHCPYTRVSILNRILTVTIRCARRAVPNKILTVTIGCARRAVPMIVTVLRHFVTHQAWSFAIDEVSGAVRRIGFATSLDDQPRNKHDLILHRQAAEAGED